MPKPRQNTPQDAETNATERLRIVGVMVEQSNSGSGRWVVKREQDGAILRDTNPAGYGTKMAALVAGLQQCGNLINCYVTTDEAYAAYLPVAQGRFTYAEPEKFARLYRAAREYERVEASRLGLPVRPDLIAQARPRRTVQP